MRRRIPTVQDIYRTLIGLLRSSAFLTTAAYGFSAWSCTLRRILGHFNVLTAAFVPCFLASICAISIERPSRRPLLALYVANVGGETLWRMLEQRNLVKSTQIGQILLFAASAGLLGYYYKRGLHLTIPKDSLFNALKYITGDIDTEQVRTPKPPKPQDRMPGRRFYLQYGVIAWLIKYYRMVVDKFKKLPKNKCCPHQDSCLSYCIGGGLKLFGTGLVVQIGLKLAFQLKKIIKKPKALFAKETLGLAVFLGGFSAIFRGVSCSLRGLTKKDDPRFVFPAILAASTALKHYPDNSIVLYIMWKSLQISYQIGVEKGYLKAVPYFSEFFYCFWTSILFHAALLEPTTMRSSYWRFLINISGGRVAAMDRIPLDAFGLETSKKLQTIMDKTNTKTITDYRW